MKPDRIDGDSRTPQEIRLALVLNGGVSLAIWMGGVVGEIDALRTARKDAGGEDNESFWRGLLEALGLEVVVDVVAGTSAGGINGALLATAIARNSALPPLRDTWIKLARYEGDLLIRDGASRVRSILDGGFFLRNLRETFAKIAPAADAEAASSQITLFMTGTALVGDHAEYIAEDEQRFTATDHRVCFAFRRSSSQDDFRDGIDEQQASRRLARAARATASFPAAFEPIFVNSRNVAHVPADSPLGEAPEGPDMHQITGLTASRWVIDGGVLDNEPFRPLLGEIAGRSLQGPVDRVIAYIVPAFSEVLPDEASDAVTAVPGVLRSVPAAYSLPRGMSSLDDFERIERIAESAATDRLARKRYLEAALSGQLTRPDDVLFRMYREGRRDATAWEIRRLVREQARAAGVYLRPPPESEQGGTCDLPWLPESIDDPFGSEGLWCWGIAVASRFVRALLNIARDELDSDASSADRQRALAEALQQLSICIEQLSAIEESMQRELAHAVSAEEAYSCTDAEVNALAVPRFKAGLAEGESSAGARLGDIVRAAATAAVTTRALPKDWGDLEGAPGVQQLIRRFLWAEVHERASAAPEYSPTPRFRFYRFGLNPPTWFLDSELSFTQKLMGAQLFHFGAFFKDEWRAYDWTWGRLDGAAHLVAMLVTRENLARADGDALANLIGDGIDVGAALDQLRRAMEQGNQEEAEKQVRRLRAALVRVHHAAILRAELPTIADQWDEDAPDALVGLGSMPGDGALREAWTATCHKMSATSALSLTSSEEGREILGLSVASSLRALSLDEAAPRKLGVSLRVLAWGARGLTKKGLVGGLLRLAVVAATLALLTLAVWAPVDGLDGVVLRVLFGFIGGLLTPLALWLLPGRLRGVGRLVLKYWSRLVGSARGQLARWG